MRSAQIAAAVLTLLAVVAGVTWAQRVELIGVASTRPASTEPASTQPSLKSIPVFSARRASTQPTQPARPTQPLKPALSPEAQVARLAKLEQRRREARQLVAGLASAAPEELADLEARLLAVGPEAMVPLKLAGLSDNYELRRRAAGIAKRLRWHLVAPKSLRAKFPAVVETMAGSAAEDRASVVDAVADWAKPEATNFLAECLTDSQVYVRQRAVDGLVKVVDECSSSERAPMKTKVGGVLTELLDDPDRNVRLLAISAMMQGDMANVPRLAGMLGDESMEIRATALKALGFSRKRAALEYVVPLLEDPQWRVRAAALEAIKQLAKRDDYKKVGPAVIRRLEDPEPFVRNLAVKLVGKWKLTDAGDAILEQIRREWISEAAGFEALAQMGTPSAKLELIGRYRDAKTPQRRGELLGYLNNYRKDTQVDKLFGDALTDKAMRPAWPTLMSLATRRVSWKKLYPSVTEHLLDDDDELAKAAWDAIGYRTDEAPLPAKVRRGLLEADDPTRICWALLAAYSWNGSDLEKTLLVGLEHSSAEVVVQALGIVAGELLAGDALGVDKPRYRRNRDRSSIRGAGGGKAKIPGKMLDPIRRLLRHPDPFVHLRAAAILYRTDTDKGEDIRRLIRQGLRREDPAVQVLALAAIQDDPAPFHDDMDMEALARGEVTASRAVRVIAALGDERYVPLLIDLSQKDNSQLLLAMLVRSGQDKALAAAVERLKGLEGWDLLRFGREHLTGMAGPGPVRIVDWVFRERREHLRSYGDDWLKVLVSLDHPSSKELLIDVLDNGKTWMPEWQYNNVRAEILIRLSQVDPDSYRQRIEKELRSGTLETRYQFIQQALKMPPTDAMVDMVFEMTTAGAARRADLPWRGVAGWLPEAAFRDKFFPSLPQLPSDLQAGLVERAARSFGPKDLPVLLGVGDLGKNWKLREALAALIASLTASSPQDRPFLARIPAEALPLVLVAAGDWPDAPEVLRPFLNDSRAPVAAAACEGLAYYLIGHPQAELTEQDQAALIAAVSGADVATAYLASEVLGAFAPDALRGLDPLTLQGSPAIARGLLTRATDLTADERRKLNTLLQGPHGPTTVRLAAATAVKAGPEGVQPNIRMIDWRGRLSQRRLVALVAAGSQPEDLLALPPPAALSADQREALAPLARELIEQVRLEPPGRMLIEVVRNGWLESPQPSDLHPLLRSAKSLRDPSEGPASREFAKDYLQFVMSWAPPQSDPDVLKRMRSGSREGVLSAAVAWLRWGDQKGLSILLTAVANSYDHPIRQAMALEALRLGLDEASAIPLAAHARSLDPQDWRDAEVLQVILNVLIETAPAQARDVLWDKEGAWRDERALYRVASTARDVMVVLADDEGIKLQSDQVSMRWSTQGWLAPLREARATANGDDQTSQLTLRLLPPWNLAGGRSPRNADSADEILKQLEGQLRSQAVRPTGDAGLLGGTDLQILTTTMFKEAIDELQGGQGVIRIEGGSGRLIRVDSAFVASSINGESGSAEDYYLLAPDGWRQGYMSLAARILSDQEKARLLRPLLTGERVDRIRGLRRAADLQANVVADDVAGMLDDPKLAVEAAWSLAMLRGPEAVDPIAGAYRSHTDFDLRVRLACLLRLLGSDVGEATVHRAVELWVTRRFRLIFAEYALSGAGYRRQHRTGIGSNPLTTRLMPWRAALLHAASDLIDQAEARYILPEQGPVSTLSPADLHQRPQGRVEPLTLVGSELTAGDLRTHGLPLAPLVLMEGDETPAFARRCESEQDLEPVFAVQFADRASTAVDLQNRWRQWWRANGDKSRDHWWRQAVGQAVEELTHKRWWHRCRAARRLERLTGRAVAGPALFDTDGWRALQKQWNAWRQDHADDTRDACLIRQGIEAEVLPAAAAGKIDEAATLRHLIRLAGWGDERLAEAALLRLETFECTTFELLLAALPWQQCPRPSLAHWVRSRAGVVVARKRLTYTADDLSAAAAGASELSPVD
ncbi:hypothetical protein LCGC14_0016460 [marine sediment metagenome]|uniref:HEAT repeat domain-containing protein n=1 Tax=marine sediment metagenome TaxID=412755 RepID=A0A0F9W473_9ZZZZ|nr:HEAT repeat domain-containing protein [Phycisphaerae bacterium]HDZ42855.1 HEAT repeat domain-containing protein [Phycisphaerae bacterium]